MLNSLSIFCNFRQKLQILFFFVIQLIISILEFATLGLIPIFIIFLTNPNEAYDKINDINDFLSKSFIEINLLQSISSIFILMSALLLIKNFLQIIQIFIEAYLVKVLNYQTINKVFNFNLNQSLTKIISNKSSDYLRNINSESTQSIGYLISQFMILKESILLFSIIFIIYFNNKFIALVVCVFILLMFIMIYFTLNKKLLKKGKAAFNSKSNLIQGITNYLGIFKEIKIYKLERFFTNYFQKNLRIKLKNDMFKYIVSKIARNLFEVIFILIIIFLMLLAKGASLDIKEYLPLLGLVIVAFMRILPTMTSINSSYAGLVYNKISFQTIKKTLINYSKISQNKSDDINFIKIKNFKKLKFSYLNFKYGNKTIFNNFSFEINKNKITGIIGQSGVGKSTLLNIITGILKVKDMKLYIDKKKLINRKFELTSLGYVPQETFLINGTILDNIALGKDTKNINDSKIKKILDASGVNELFNKTKLNLNSNVSDKGQNLSGGQVQRIGIARALYREPSFLLLDEATNQIDKENKIKILEKIRKNFKNLTTIIISHDTDIVKYCDHLIHLNE
jgi:ABC-type multidrug transport system fused ATPase/permease subunit